MCGISSLSVGVLQGRPATMLADRHSGLVKCWAKGCFLTIAVKFDVDSRTFSGANEAVGGRQVKVPSSGVHKMGWLEWDGMEVKTLTGPALLKQAG